MKKHSSSLILKYTYSPLSNRILEMRVNTAENDCLSLLEDFCLKGSLSKSATVCNAMIVVFGTNNVLLLVDLVYRHYFSASNTEYCKSLNTDHLFTTKKAIIILCVSRQEEPSMSGRICMGGKS
jgi:hypothetical protein